MFNISFFPTFLKVIEMNKRAWRVLLEVTQEAGLDLLKSFTYRPEKQDAVISRFSISHQT